MTENDRESGGAGVHARRADESGGEESPTEISVAFAGNTYRLSVEEWLVLRRCATPSVNHYRGGARQRHHTLAWPEVLVEVDLAVLSHQMQALERVSIPSPADLADVWRWSSSETRQFLADRGFGSPPKAPKSWIPDAELPPGSPDSGVYFIQSVDGGPIKIGFSTKVLERVRAFQPGCPSRLLVLLVIEGTHQTESSLHRRFRADRLHGEWFAPSDSLLAFIEGWS